jgi:hypothetical protein
MVAVESLVCGFSPRAGNFVICAGCSVKAKQEALLADLGKHRIGTGGCLYINKLADVDRKVLARLIKAAPAEKRSLYTVTAS